MLNYALTLEYLEAEFYRQGNGADLLSGKAEEVPEARSRPTKRPT